MPVEQAAAHRVALTIQEASGPGPRLIRVPSWPFAILAGLVMFRAAVYVAAVIGGEWSSRPGALHPTWVQLAQACLYALVGASLIVLGRHDPRAWSLGAFLGAFACAMMDRYLSGSNPLLMLARGLRTDAFFGASLWFFCAVFPSRSRRFGVSAALAAGVVATTALGLALAFLDAVATFDLAVPASLASIAATTARLSPSGTDWYFSLQFLSMLPLLVLMPLKAREAGADDRRRYRWLTVGIGVAMGPLVLDVLATTLVTGLHEWTRGTIIWPLRSIAIMAGLTVLPLMSAYSALVHRTVDIGFVLRSAAQYLVARYAAHALVSTPLVVALIVVIANRDRSLSEMASSPIGLMLGAIALISATALASRHRLLRTIDSRFFREEIDAQATFLSLTHELQRADSIESLAQKAQAAVDGAFHPIRVVVCIEDSKGQLVAQNVDLPSLASGSALAQIAGGDDRPLQIDAMPPTMMSRLPVEDRHWLEQAHAALLVPLRTSPREMVGLIALGERRSELPYRADDLRLLTALGSASGLAIDRLRRSATTTPAGRPPVMEAARECVECGEVLDGDAIACSCGAPLKRAPVPRLLNDRWRIIRRIGAGGFAVVYQALDLPLKQLRAVKALPLAEPAHFARLRREARMMSAVHHANLATVYALEAWGYAPLLVMEFLEGGTLADRLRRGPLGIAEVFSVGRQIASAIVSLHDSGILHRDIKPSNIGFTVDGTPKLLDFGLAKILEVHGQPMLAQASESTWSGLPGSDNSAVFRGTPAYASPEALMGCAASPADDLWSLGVTLLEAATGTNPFKAATPAAVAARVLTDDGRVQQCLEALPLGARDLFAVLLAREPHRRAQSSRAFVAQLNTVAINSRQPMTTKEGRA